MKKMICNFRSIMMPVLTISLSIMLMLCSGGCGIQQKEQTEDVKDLVATGSAVYLEGEQDEEAVQKQLKLLTQNADKWIIDASKEKYRDVRYAVTDLDHNRRLEIMALAYDYFTEGGGYVLQKCFELSASGDAIEKIGTEQLQGVLLGDYDLEEFNTAYFDPKTGEYHYIIRNEEETDEEAEEDYEYSILALTLKDGQLTSTDLGIWEQQGKEIQYFYVDPKGKKTEIDKEKYNADSLGALFYPDCGKFDLQVSGFTFDHDLEEHIYHAIKRAYGNCFQGYPLEKTEKKIHGYPIAVPQYTTMQDSKKQKRINRMICEQVEKSLGEFYDLRGSKFTLDYADITIKYAGRSRVSLLLEAQEGAVTANEYCDTININLEQEKLLSGEDLLPEQYREDVEEEIEGGYARGLHGGDAYQESLEKNKADLFPTMRAKGWQDVKIYQTRDNVGVVIPTEFGLDAYVIYELSRDWDLYGTGYEEESGEVVYSMVDWEAYQYKLLPEEYQSLQSYMPVLTGGKEFTLIEEDDEMEIERRNLTIDGLAREYYDYIGTDELPEEEVTLACISICDLTQDGTDELILQFSLGSLYLVLHQEGDAYYAVIHGRRSLQGLQKDGLYHAGKDSIGYYRMRFEKDVFVDTYIGGDEYDSEKDSYKYYIGDKKVEEAEYKKWEKSMEAEKVLWYTPEVLQEKRKVSWQ